MPHLEQFASLTDMKVLFICLTLFTSYHGFAGDLRVTVSIFQAYRGRRSLQGKAIARRLC